MPVQIGAKAHPFTEPTGLLSDCHRRVEGFLGILERVANLLDRPPTEEARSALEAALRYFAEAAPRHTADEEESLFPRLRRSERPELQPVLTRLEQIENEHRWAVPLHGEIERLGRKYILEGALTKQEADQFRRDVAELTSMYQKHIAFEDQELFPVAAATLSEAEKRAIANEMAGRRGTTVIGSGESRSAL